MGSYKMRMIIVSLTLAGSDAALAQATGAQPSTIPPSMVYRERIDNANKLDFDREREEVKKKGPVRSVDGRELKLTRGEQDARNRIETALAKKDFSGAGKAISAALAKAQTADARYTFAALQLQLGYATQSSALQDQAVEAAIASGVAPATLLPQLYRHQGVAALQAKNYPAAEVALGKLVELTPQDAEAVVLLAESKNRARKPGEALPLFQKAVSLKKAANLPVPPEWNRAVEVMAAMVKAQGNRPQ